MRIDEVVQEAPVGMIQRGLNFAQSKIGSADFRARGQGKRDVADVANTTSAKINRAVGQAGIDVRNAEEVLSNQYLKIVTNYFKAEGLDPKFSKLYTQEWNKVMKELFTPLDPTKPDEKKVKEKDGHKKIVDSILVNTIQQAYKQGLIGALPDVRDADGDGKPDAPQDGNANLSPADSALKGALDKLDPEMQKKALAYLQSKS